MPSNTPSLSTLSTCFIVNPHSAGGRTQREWPGLAQQLTAAFGEVAVRFTQGQGDAIQQTRASLDEGHQLVVAVGGDGTNNEVINGMFKADGTPYAKGARFAFYPSGSGGDLRRSLPAATSAAQLIRLIKEGEDKKVDLGRITCLDGQDQQVTRFFLNIASFGVSAMVNQKVSQSTKPFGGTVAFLMASTSSIFSYKNATIELVCDDGPPETTVSNVVAIANGRCFGGGMKIAPDAAMDDGWFELVNIGDHSKLELLLNGSTVYRGTHIHNPKNSVKRVKKVVARSLSGPLWLDVDGEMPGQLPATFTILPNHLTVRMPPAKG